MGLTSTTGGFCPDGTIVCEGNVAKTCDGMSGFSNEEECGDDVETCDGVQGVMCDANSVVASKDNTKVTLTPSATVRRQAISYSVRTASSLRAS